MGTGRGAVRPQVIYIGMGLQRIARRESRGRARQGNGEMGEKDPREQPASRVGFVLHALRCARDDAKPPEEREAAELDGGLDNVDEEAMAREDDRNKESAVTGSDTKHAATDETKPAIPSVTPEEVREAVFPNAVENVIFSRLLFELGSDDIAVRAKAARAMAGIHHELSVRALSSQLLSDTSAQVRKECVDALAALEMAAGLPAVERALGDAAPSVRLAAVRGVYRLGGPHAGTLLVRMFTDENELVRCRAATCAGWLSEPILAVPLMDLLDDKSATVRRATVEAMGYLNSTQAVAALIEHLDDSDELVRRKALEAVRSITGKRMAEEGDQEEEQPTALIARWREWWKENGEEFLLHESRPRPGARAHADGEDGVLSRRSTDPAAHQFERQNKELLVRIKELELQLASRDSEPDSLGAALDDSDIAEVSEESTDIISIVRGLERELDAAFDLKESLETDLARTQERLEMEQTARHDLEGRLELAQAQAALADQLREEVAFVKEERDVLSRRNEEASVKLTRLSGERDTLQETLESSTRRVDELQRDKIDLEAQVFNLRDKLKEYAAAIEMRQVLEEKVGRLTGQLKALETTRNTLESELSKTREEGYGLREENDRLQQALTSANTDLTDLRERLQEQCQENTELVEANNRFDRELTALRVKHEATSKLLDAAKRSLRDIRSAAKRTTEHFRERYYKPIDEK